MPLSRRSFLSAGLGITVVTAATSVGVTGYARADAPGVKGDPFLLGVASGDPVPDGFVIWTRLALDPLAEDGLGGMPNRPVTVQWEVAEDEKMTRVVARGEERAVPDSAHSVHVELFGLRPGREYFYRFRTGDHMSAVGRALTTPSATETAAALTMAFASCAQYEHGWFTAYRRMAEDNPDLVLHLGDYLYEYTSGGYTSDTGLVRSLDGPETVTLANYRQRHAQYKADADLQAAHAIAPWLVVWDDHEVDNNWAGTVPENTDATQGNDTSENFLARRAAAFQAYYENMPLRPSSTPTGHDMKIFRRIRWGTLANFHMLDTRQYRDDQAAGDGWKKNVAERHDEARTLTGTEQEQWLLDGFRTSTVQWDFLGQQVFFAEQDKDPSPEGDEVSMDGWDGYAASRRRITQGLGGFAGTQRRRAHRRRAPALGQRHQGRLHRSRRAGSGFGTGVHVDHVERQRHRRDAGRAHGGEPAPEVPQRPARLRAYHDHPGRRARRLPGARHGHRTRRAGVDGGVVRHRVRSAGSAAAFVTSWTVGTR